jgi:O-antigen/teichoic acid export membrane protein
MEHAVQAPQLDSPAASPHDGTSRTAGRIAGFVSLSLATSVAIQALNVVSGIITARLLGPEGKGELTAVVLWPGLFANLGQIGIAAAVTYFTAREPDRARAIFATSQVLVVFQSAVLMACGYLVIPIVLQNYGEAVVGVARLYLWWIPINFATLYAMAMLAGRLDFAAYSAVRLTVISLTVLGLLGVVRMGSVSVESAVWVYLGANALTLALVLVLCARRGWIGLRPDRQLLVGMSGYGLKLHTAGVAGMVNERGDQMMISILIAPAQLGLYAIAVSLSSIAGHIGSTIATVAMPTVAQASDRGQALALLCRFIRTTVMLSALLSAAVFILAPTVIEVLFGPAFVPATDVARLLAVAVIALNATWALGSGLAGFGYPLVPAFAQVAALVVTLISLAVLLPLLGLIGAGVASLLAYCTSLAYMVEFARRQLGVPVSTLLMPTRRDLLDMARLGRSAMIRIRIGRR